MATFDLSPGVADFQVGHAGIEGCVFVESDWHDGYTYRYDGGEANLHLYRERGMFKIAWTARGSRNLAAFMSSPTLELIERMFIAEAGEEYREREALPEIVLPLSRAGLKEGYSIAQISHGVYALVQEDGTQLPLAISDWIERPWRCVGYSHIVGIAVTGLIESYKSETGVPFLQDYVVTPDGA